MILSLTVDLAFSFLLLLFYFIFLYYLFFWGKPQRCGYTIFRSNEDAMCRVTVGKDLWHVVIHNVVDSSFRDLWQKTYGICCKRIIAIACYFLSLKNLKATSGSINLAFACTSLVHIPTLESVRFLYIIASLTRWVNVSILNSCNLIVRCGCNDFQ